MHNYLSMVTCLRKLTKYDQNFVQCFQSKHGTSIDPAIYRHLLRYLCCIWAGNLQTYGMHPAQAVCVNHSVSAYAARHQHSRCKMPLAWFLSIVPRTHTTPRYFDLWGVDHLLTRSGIALRLRVLKAGRLSLALTAIINQTDASYIVHSRGICRYVLWE